ncbi:MAG: glycoside hydrolase family protein [Planctomycetota bacterium]
MRFLRLSVFVLCACATPGELELRPGPVDIVVNGAFATGDSVLSLPGRFVWGGSVVKGRDGRFHMLFNTWKTGPDSPPFRDAWVLHSEIGHAVSDRPDGGFEFTGVVLRGAGADAWDAQVVTNPHLRVFDGRFHLYYVGSRDPGPQSAGSPGERLSKRNRVQQCQRIGVIVFDSFEDLVAGDFERPSEPLLAPRTRVKDRDIVDPSPTGTTALPDNIVVVNPSVVFDRPRNRYLLYFKGNVYTPHWKGVHGVAVADSPTGPFRALDDIVFDVRMPDGSLASAEDPYVWRRGDRFHAIVKDFTGAITGGSKGLARLVSDDGIAWRPADSPLFSKKQLVDRAGNVIPVDRLERPQLLLDEAGTPRVLNAACSIKPCNDRRDGSTFNVQIPLR